MRDAPALVAVAAGLLSGGAPAKGSLGRKDGAKTSIEYATGVAAIAALTRRTETGASGGVVPPSGMVDERIRQVRAGLPSASIATRAPIPAGPERRVFVGMTVDGMKWGCRVEDHGSFAPFRNFAN